MLSNSTVIQYYIKYIKWLTSFYNHNIYQYYNDFLRIKTITRYLYVSVLKLFLIRYFFYWSFYILSVEGSVELSIIYNE